MNEGLPSRKPDDSKPRGLYTCQVISGPCSKRVRVMNLIWDGKQWRYTQGYRFKNTVCVCYGPIPNLELPNANARIHSNSPQE